MHRGADGRVWDNNEHSAHVAATLVYLMMGPDALEALIEHARKTAPKKPTDG